MTDSSDPLQAAKEALTSGRRFSRGVVDSAQQIWLAGLGALSRTQQEGDKFFDTLVEEGVRIQEKTHAFAEEQVKQAETQAEPWITAAQERTQTTLGKLEKAFDTHVTRAMKRMQLASQTDVEALADRIDALTRAMRAQQAAGAGATAKGPSAARKGSGTRPAAKG